MMTKLYCVYIMTNKNNAVLYTGVTGDLKKRVYQHINKLVDGFTKRYNLHKLVYYQAFGTPEKAILKEKQIKGGSRKKKIALIQKQNPNWEDLYSML